MNLLKAIQEDGYVLVKDVGLDDPDQALETAIAAFARPISYLELPLVMDLKPKPGFQPASYAGTGVFDLHTDLSWFEKPPKYIAMFCVMPESAGGGIPLLADGWQALNSLDAADVAYLQTHPITFPPPDHIDYPALTAPIITAREEGPFIRFRYDLLDNPPQPVQNFFAAVNDNLIHVDVSPGSMFIFDNDRMLHGRTELKGGLTSDRHFKRLYGEVE